MPDRFAQGTTDPEPCPYCEDDLFVTRSRGRETAWYCQFHEVGFNV